MQTALRVMGTPENPGWTAARDEQKANLAQVATKRDRAAFEQLFTHYGPRVKSMMIKAGAPPDQAEDLVQDVMMTVWRKAALYSPAKGAVSTWIFTIARNARIDRLRRQSSRPYEDVDNLDVADESDDGEAELYAAQKAGLIAEAMVELPDEQKQIIELAFMHDLPQSRIADRLSVPLGTVKSRLRLAYGKLKVKLEDLQ
jgi:RNA polymerase sigma-70 factor (ECF subfamily)